MLVHTNCLVGTSVSFNRSVRLPWSSVLIVRKTSATSRQLAEFSIVHSNVGMRTTRCGTTGMRTRNQLLMQNSNEGYCMGHMEEKLGNRSYFPYTIVSMHAKEATVSSLIKNIKSIKRTNDKR